MHCGPKRTMRPLFHFPFISPRRQLIESGIEAWRDGWIFPADTASSTAQPAHVYGRSPETGNGQERVKIPETRIAAAPSPDRLHLFHSKEEKPGVSAIKVPPPRSKSSTWRVVWAAPA